MTERTALLEVLIHDITDGTAHVAVLASPNRAIEFTVPETALEPVNPLDCDMVHIEPFDFAQCNTHDTTFPLGDQCKFHGRDPFEVIYEEASQQRSRAVMAEMARDEAIEEVARLRREIELLSERIHAEEDPTVLLVDKFTSTCGDCGRRADPTEQTHEFDKGCGRKFTHIGSRYLITRDFEDRLRKMRPDLIFTKRGAS